MCRRKRSCALSLAAIFSLTAIPAAQRNVWNGRSADSPARIYAAESCADSLAAGGEKTSVSAERMPRFCGGDINDFRRWLQAQVIMPPEMPDSCEQGTVVARFVVEKDGTPSQIEIVRSPSDALSREAIAGDRHLARMGDGSGRRAARARADVRLLPLSGRKTRSAVPASSRGDNPRYGCRKYSGHSLRFGRHHAYVPRRRNGEIPRMVHG